MKRFTFILALVMSMLSFTNAKADKLSISSAESDITAYKEGFVTYSTSNVYDGSFNTKFWTSDSPEAGYKFTVYLGSSANVGDIKLYFDNGDLPSEGAVIEVNDNGTWTQVGEPLNGIQANDVVTRNAGGVYTEQIRLRFTQPSAYWFRLLEFEVYEYEVAIQERTISAVAGEGGSVTINGGSEAVTGTDKVQLVATPDYGYKFARWTVGGEEVSTSAEYTDNTDGNKEYVAVFEKFASSDEWYAAIEKPTFGKAGNTTFVKSATVSGGVEAEVTGIPAEIGQTSVTGAIEVTPGAEFNLNITYHLNWGDLAIYQIDNDGATKEYGYYFGSWTATDPNTGKVIENIANDGISVSDIVDDVCTVTYPISINENHNVGDVIVVRAITGVTNNTTNSAFEKNIVEGGYVDFLFVVAEEEEPAFSHTLTVTEDGWATLFLGFNARIPSAVEAYTVTTVNDGWVSLTQVTGVLPLNQGVIIKAPAGDYKFFYEETATADVTGNLLSGSAYNKNIDEEAYVLGKVDGVVGLYKAEKNQMDGTAWLNNANKAYLPASAVPNKSAAFYGFDWDGTTGVEKVEIRNEKSEIYDLTGRRVENITAPGIYVVGGKKVLVK